MIIDFHTHSFPDSLAPKAMASLAITFSSIAAIKPQTDGTAGGAKKILSDAGISKAVVCNIATNARQETKVNDYAISLLADGFFYPFGSVHPDSEKIESELDRLKSAGIKGIKLHPDYVKIPLNDPRYNRIFEALTDRQMLVVVHAGFDPISPDKIHATAEMFRGVIEKYPDLKIVAAHMGGYAKAKDVYENLVGTGIYFDTSLSSMREDEKEILYKILREHDENKILFGTDTPWSVAKAEIEFIKNAPISEEYKEKIFYKNALALLKD
ncbi:MAG: amidohydrolase family protein [Clostridia bacterium]|nr:amidohydrolase family protein [Clostridia bacterium]